MKTILLPTDFSADAAKAYPLAVSLAKKYNTGIKLFHLLKSHMLEFSSVGLGNRSILPTENELITTLEKSDVNKSFENLLNGAIFKDVEISTAISGQRETNPAQDIINELNSSEYGMIIMGTSGAVDEGETNAEIVARNTNIPLVTCKEEVTEFEPKNILLCTDFETYTMGFLSRVKDLASQYDAKLHLLYVNTHKHFKTNAEVEREAQKLKRKFRLGNFHLHVYNANTPTQGILEYIKREPIDMVAVSTHGRRGLSHFFNGSNAEDLINDCPVPVYTYNLHEYLATHSKGYAVPMTRGFSG